MKKEKLLSDVDDDELQIPDDVTDLRRQELEESKRLMQLIKEPPITRLLSPDSAVGRPLGKLVESVMETKISRKKKNDDSR